MTEPVPAAKPSRLRALLSFLTAARIHRALLYALTVYTALHRAHII
jgi:hypothetical protein